MLWKIKGCPRCGSTDVLFSVEGEIQFRIDTDGEVRIISSPDDLREIVEDELSEYGADAHCEKCGLVFRG